MRRLDTNVVVRLLIGDHPEQTQIAETAFPAAIASGGVYLPDVVLAEVAWVLRSYERDRTSRYTLLERLVRSRGVAVDDIDAVIDALEQFRQGGDRGPLNDTEVLTVDQDADGHEVMGYDEAGGTSSPPYCITFGDEAATGLQGRFDGRCGISVRDLGEVSDAPVFRTRVDWYIGFACKHPRCVGRLHGIEPPT